MLDKLGGRKFMLTLIVIAVGTAVQILSQRGVTVEFTALLVGASAAFTGANAVLTSKGISAQAVTNDVAPSDPMPQFDPAPIQAQVQETQLAINTMKQGLEAHASTLAALQQGNELTQKLLKTALAVK